MGPRPATVSLADLAKHKEGGIIYLWYYKLFTLHSLLLHCNNSAALLLKTKFGLAMVGEPKYNAESTHLRLRQPWCAKRCGTLKTNSHLVGSTHSTLILSKVKLPRWIERLSRIVLMARVWDEPFTMYPVDCRKCWSARRSFFSITFNLDDPKAQVSWWHQKSQSMMSIFSYEIHKRKRPSQPTSNLSTGHSH